MHVTQNTSHSLIGKTSWASPTDKLLYDHAAMHWLFIALTPLAFCALRTSRMNTPMHGYSYNNYNINHGGF